MKQFLTALILTACISSLHAISIVDRNLLNAAIAGNRWDIDQALCQGAQINATDKDGYTALHHAAQHGHRQAVGELLDNGTDINGLTRSKKTALQLADEHGHDSVSRILLEHGAEDHDAQKDLIKAAEEGNVAAANYLLKNRNCSPEYTLPDTKKPYAPTPSAFMKAVERDDRYMVNLFLSHTASPNALNEALIEASSRGHRDIVKTLLDHNADANATDKISSTPLMLACIHKHTEIVELLLEHGANPNVALSCACNSDEIAELLVKYGAHGNNPKALLNAVMADNKKIVRFLLDAGTPITNQEEYPLLHAVFSPYYNYHKSDPTIIRLLLDHGADANRYYLGKTPLYEAIRCNSDEETIALLLSKTDIHTHPATVDPILHYAITFASKGLRYKVIRLLIDAGADINAKSGYANETPLHRAIEEGYLDVVQLLVSRGASINERGFKGRTPLHYACWKSESNIHVVNFLIDQGADVNTRDDEGNTPLHLAEFFGRSKIISLLIQRGADKLQRNNAGETAEQLGKGQAKFRKEWNKYIKQERYRRHWR